VCRGIECTAHRAAGKQNQKNQRTVEPAGSSAHEASATVSFFASARRTVPLLLVWFWFCGVRVYVSRKEGAFVCLRVERPFYPKQPPTPLSTHVALSTNGRPQGLASLRGR
jgi:hypothetical protein